jgi:hypothetical protein
LAEKIYKIKKDLEEKKTRRLEQSQGGSFQQQQLSNEPSQQVSGTKIEIKQEPNLSHLSISNGDSTNQKISPVKTEPGCIGELLYRVAKKVGAYTIGGGPKKFFLEMTPLRVKTWEFEFEIFEAKKRFSDSGKAYCILKRKVAKMRFLSKNDVKMALGLFTTDISQRKSGLFTTNTIKET